MALFLDVRWPDVAYTGAAQPLLPETGAQINHDPPSRIATMTLHGALRAATRSDHTVVDGLVTRLDLSQREDYGRLLSTHHAVLQDLKSEWRAEDRDDFREMGRRLQNDLRVLGFPTAASRATLRPAFAEGDQLGVAYVIRGSRLGSGVLRPRIPAQYSATYFDFAPTLSWAKFLAQLQSVPAGEASDAAIRGAKFTFGIFSCLLGRAVNA
jgi:heme oxygenase